MRIGIDLDNTIVVYDRLFHAVACGLARLPGSVPQKKVAVRDYLRSVGQEQIWTELQGEVYGPRMQEAEPYDGAIDSIQRIISQGHELFIISHRTRQPFRGPAHDLHTAAKEWINRRLLANGKPLVTRDHVFLEATKEDKIARIERCKCDVFVDDLPEILMHERFPPSIRKILFDPDARHAASYTDSLVARSWDELTTLLGP